MVLVGKATIQHLLQLPQPAVEVVKEEEGQQTIPKMEVVAAVVVPMTNKLLLEELE
jgi:hypothetical protein